MWLLDTAESGMIPFSPPTGKQSPTIMENSKWQICGYKHVSGTHESATGPVKQQDGLAGGHRDNNEGGLSLPLVGYLSLQGGDPMM